MKKTMYQWVAFLGLILLLDACSSITRPDIRFLPEQNFAIADDQAYEAYNLIAWDKNPSRIIYVEYFAQTEAGIPFVVAGADMNGDDKIEQLFLTPDLVGQEQEAAIFIRKDNNYWYLPDSDFEDFTGYMQNRELEAPTLITDANGLSLIQSLFENMNDVFVSYRNNSANIPGYLQLNPFYGIKRQPERPAEDSSSCWNPLGLHKMRPSVPSMR